MFFNKTKKKVLVIDDDASLLRRVRARLENHEAVKVIDAIDGEKGLIQANNHTPDLIILDWMLPGVQGTEVLKKLRALQKTKRTPVLMLTGRNKIGDIEDVFNLGANAYLTKPFSLQKLGEKVSEMLNSNNIK
jgi:DNA-binding response OmpR family regulator